MTGAGEPKRMGRMALLLAVACLPLRALALDDADLLFCAQVYADTASLFGQERDTDLRRLAEDAQRRLQPLSERDYDLLNESPRRHARASAAAEARLAALPAVPAAARRDGLRQAYADCRVLQDGKSAVTATTSHVPAPLSSSPAAPAPAGLGDADLLYCAQVYGEVGNAADGDGDGEAADVARDALERWRPLSERDNDLLNSDPARYSRGSAEAARRLAALPQKPGRARGIALRAAYDDCRALEARAGVAPAEAVAGADRVQLLANRHFCRELLQRTLKVGPKVRAGFTPSERAALDDIQKIAAALAQPLPGPAPTPEQDREASRLRAQLRNALDLAVARWDSGPDPVVQAMGQCHDDYAQGRLGGPDVLSAAGDEAVADAAAALPAVALAPVVQPADLGAVFHMREMTPVGVLDGIWVRRGRSNLYDGVWVNGGNGQLQRDVLELRGIVDGELTLYRQSYRGSYRARVRSNGTLASGAASWYGSEAYSWSALPPQYVRAASGSLGAVVHMREVTPQGNFDGIWRQRGQTGIYDVLWVFLPTGQVTSDVLQVTGVAQGQLVIRRLAGPSLFAVPRRADRPRPRGRQEPSRWVVLPAQPVRLGGSGR